VSLSILFYDQSPGLLFTKFLSVCLGFSANVAQTARLNGAAYASFCLHLISPFSKFGLGNKTWLGHFFARSFLSQQRESVQFVSPVILRFFRSIVWHFVNHGRGHFFTIVFAHCLLRGPWAGSL